jgi:uncharacterized protein YecT (DUF1311 family)
MTDRWRTKLLSGSTVFAHTASPLSNGLKALTCTHHNRFAYENYSELLDDLVSALARFEKGEMPHFTHADFIKADRELNQVYTEAMKERRDADQQAPPEAHRATADGMRKTERLWLAYLVAWLQFARQKYPAVTEDSWRTWLTQQRVCRMARCRPGNLSPDTAISSIRWLSPRMRSRPFSIGSATEPRRAIPRTCPTP